VECAIRNLDGAREAALRGSHYAVALPNLYILVPRPPFWGVLLHVDKGLAPVPDPYVEATNVHSDWHISVLCAYFLHR